MNYCIRAQLRKITKQKTIEIVEKRGGVTIKAD